MVMKFLSDFGQRLPETARKDVENFVAHGECGLAYDLLVFLVQDEGVGLPDEAVRAIKSAGKAMGIEYPQLSTD